MTLENIAATLLKIDDATVRRSDKNILDHLSLEIAQGQHTAILGPNGSGKSTLIKLITRQHYPLAREDGKPIVTLFGQDRWDVFSLRSLMGIVSADLHQDFVVDGTMCGMEAVISGFFASHGLARHHEVTEAMRERALQALMYMDAMPLAGKRLEQMSTGEARRVLIARALAPDPLALLLDEPTTGLDLVARRRFLRAVSGIAQLSKTVILVTHHVDEILPEIERVVLLKDGGVFRDGPKEKILTSENLSALFGEPIEVHRNGGYYGAEAV